jgi:HEAT repeat protein
MPELRTMNGDPQPGMLILFLHICSGDPERAMEAAKLLIGMPEDIHLTRGLSFLVANQDYKDWSRIAAAYVLGFVPPSAETAHPRILRQVLRDKRNSVRVRTHVAESLGNLRDIEATPLLKQLLFNPEESTSVRKWCIYALSEIGSAESRQVLNTFEQTKPSGVLAAEMSANGIDCEEVVA